MPYNPVSITPFGISSISYPMGMNVNNVNIMLPK